MGYKKRFEYAVLTLEKELNKNKNELLYWQGLTEDENPLTVRMAKGNIGGCESRIKDIEECLLFINPPAQIEIVS